MDNFYRELPAFSDFGKIADISSYIPAPEDWVVALADIRGSTKAIEEGRYKDVNMAGAACITAVLNACKPLDIPFVFGGDGGAVILPETYAQKAGGALHGLQSFTKNTLDLDLRVGILPVSFLRQKGADILIRKFELSPGNFLAMVAGGGLELADEILKTSANTDSLLPDDLNTSIAPDLDGLSCRWEPLRPNLDHIVALLVRNNGAGKTAQAELTKIMVEIESILGRNSKKISPVNKSSLRFRWPPKGLRLEARLTSKNGAAESRYWSLLGESFYQLLCETFKIKLGSYDGAKYREELKTNTDFRKYDDMLRLVLDVSESQLRGIDEFLEREFQAGRLAYGLHVADSALMTCLVFNLEQSQHVHFIDAANGGFARAAIDFKKRVKSLGV